MAFGDQGVRLFWCAMGRGHAGVRDFRRSATGGSRFLAHWGARWCSGFEVFTARRQGVRDFRRSAIGGSRFLAHWGAWWCSGFEFFTSRRQGVEILGAGSENLKTFLFFLVWFFVCFYFWAVPWIPRTSSSSFLRTVHFLFHPRLSPPFNSIPRSGNKLFPPQ